MFILTDEDGGPVYLSSSACSRDRQATTVAEITRIIVKLAQYIVCFLFSALFSPPKNVFQVQIYESGPCSYGVCGGKAEVGIKSFTLVMFFLGILNSRAHTIPLVCNGFAVDNLTFL